MQKLSEMIGIYTIQKLIIYVLTIHCQLEAVIRVTSNYNYDSQFFKYAAREILTVLEILPSFTSTGQAAIAR